MESVTDYAFWLLAALGRRSPRPILKMEPANSLETLELDELDIRSLTDSMRVYIKTRKPPASLAKAEVDKAKSIRGELQLLVAKIDDVKLSDESADTHVIAARKRHGEA